MHTHRQIVLDTETTGLEVRQGHRIIEIGAVELVNRRHTGHHFHHYLQPDRAIDEEAVAVHGITAEFLRDQPRFADIAEAFIEFIRGAELIIHNAAFDIGFIDSELERLGPDAGVGNLTVSSLCTVCDTLELARYRHPGQRNTLDALCKRYNVDNSERTLHGALLDAEILADVYLLMTGGQVGLALESQRAATQTQSDNEVSRPLLTDRPALPVIEPSPAEQAAHERYLDILHKSSGGQCLWRELDENTGSETH